MLTSAQVMEVQLEFATPAIVEARCLQQARTITRKYTDFEEQTVYTFNDGSVYCINRDAKDGCYNAMYVDA